MPVLYNQTLRNARMTEVLDAIDASGAANHAKLLIGTGSGNTLGTQLAEIELNHPSFTMAGGILTLSVTPAVETDSGGADAGGTASVARIVTGANAVVVFGLSVGDSSTTPTPDVVLNSTAISQGQTVSITSGHITHSNNAATPS